MITLDPGHLYRLAVLDGEQSEEQFLRFVKREGDKYPGNVGHHSGVQAQEVLRVLIARILFVDGQQPNYINQQILKDLRSAIVWLERRAWLRHGLGLMPNDPYPFEFPETWPVNSKGHSWKEGL